MVKAPPDMEERTCKFCNVEKGDDNYIPKVNIAVPTTPNASEATKDGSVGTMVKAPPDKVVSVVPKAASNSARV